MTQTRTSEAALVVATYRREMDIRTADGCIRRARIKGRQLKPVCGDAVIAAPLPGEPLWLITTICERKNVLTRPNARGHTEVLAANLDCVCVVAATEPLVDWFIVDRYLAAAELMHADAVVIYNKTDLREDDTGNRDVLATYRRIGYPTLPCSARTGEGMAQFAQLLSARTSIIVGQSGVGKSTLINHLVADAALRTAAISAATGEGRHTTVNSRLLELEGGGSVIDSPGVRDYAPAVQTGEKVADGFREIRQLAADCRFANCRHLREPGCAVKSAVVSNEVSERRYESYNRLRVMSEQAGKDRG